MKHIMVAFGTRPEAIKMAPLIILLRDKPSLFKVTVCVTGQHRGMLDQVLQIFGIEPDIDLNLMQEKQDLCDITSSVLLRMRDVIRATNPDIVLVHGDTTTCLATAMAAFYSDIPIGHVEAGLRTYNMKAPFPEEFNRQVTGLISSYHFAPTVLSAKNLELAGVSADRIRVTGNTVIDALNLVLARYEKNEVFAFGLRSEFEKRLGFEMTDTKYILVTGHRRENFGDGFLNICEAIRRLSMKYEFIHFVYPVHLNPNVQSPVNEILGGLTNVHLIEPLEYDQFIFLLKNCYLVLTDSGGIQEEAPSLGKPVLVMRDVTERPEAVQAGTVELVGADKARIIAGVARLLEDAAHYQAMARAHNPYGDGLACQRIIEVLRHDG